MEAAIAQEIANGFRPYRTEDRNCDHRILGCHLTAHALRWVVAFLSRQSQLALGGAA